MKNEIFKFLKLQILIIIGWIFFFALSEIINTFSHFKDYIVIFFLPAGFIITLACIFKWECFLGIFIGAIITGLIYLNGNHICHHLCYFAIFTALSPIIAFLTVNSVTKLGSNLNEINLSTVIIIVFLFSLLSSLLHNGYLLMQRAINLMEFQRDIIIMFTGDFIGAMIFFTILAYFKEPLMKLVNKFI